MIGERSGEIGEELAADHRIENADASKDKETICDHLGETVMSPEDPERDRRYGTRAKREEKIRTMETRLAAVGNLLAEHPFAGASVWAAEIEAVVNAIARGEKTGWRF